MFLACCRTISLRIYQKRNFLFQRSSKLSLMSMYGHLEKPEFISSPQIRCLNHGYSWFRRVSLGGEDNLNLFKVPRSHKKLDFAQKFLQRNVFSCALSKNGGGELNTARQFCANLCLQKIGVVDKESQQLKRYLAGSLGLPITDSGTKDFQIGNEDKNGILLLKRSKYYFRKGEKQKKLFLIILAVYHFKTASLETTTFKSHTHKHLFLL